MTTLAQKVTTLAQKVTTLAQKVTTLAQKVTTLALHTLKRQAESKDLSRHPAVSFADVAGMEGTKEEL